MIIYRLQHKNTGLGPFSSTLALTSWYDHLGPNDGPNKEIFRDWLDKYYPDNNHQFVPSFLRFGCKSLEVLNRIFPLWDSLNIYEIIEVDLTNADKNHYIELYEDQIVFHEKYLKVTK